MSQSDLIIETSGVSGTTFGQDIQSALRAVASMSKGSSAPGTKYTGQFWLDDSGAPWNLNIWDGSDWIKVGELDAGEDRFTGVGGEGLVFREKQTVTSATAAVTFESVADGDVFIVCRGVTVSSSSAKPVVQVGNGGSATTSGYVSRIASDWGSTASGGSSSWEALATIGGTSVAFGWDIGLNNLQTIDGTEASNKNASFDVFGNLSGSVAVSHLGGYMTGLPSSVADTIVLSMSTGNISTGTFSLYGYAE